MSLFKYEAGMRVRNREGSDAGVIADVDSDDEVQVTWDSNGVTRWCETRYLMPDTPDAAQRLADLNALIQANIDEATSLLDQAFKKWRKANAMEMEGTDNPGPDSNYFEGAYALRSNEDLDLSKFEEVVERNGWSTSSLYC
jgi:hypothetical protein